MTPVRSEADLPAVFAPLLRRLRADRVRAFGAADICLTPVSYQARPFSNVVRLRVSQANGLPDTYCFAKIQTPKAVPNGESHMRQRVHHEFETTAKVELALGERPGMTALHPIACYPDLFAIVTREIHGVTLMRYLEKRVSWFSTGSRLAQAEEAVRLVGDWLRAFQTIEPSDELIDVGDLRGYIDQRLQRLVSSGQSPIDRSVRERCLRHIENLSAAIGPQHRRSVLVHADLAPGNVMVTDAGVAVLDFAMTARGTFLHDVSRLALQIDLMRGKPHFRPSSVRRVVAALLGEFATDIGGVHPLFRLLTLRHRINHLATLTLQPSRGTVRLYHWRLRRMHYRSLLRELRTPITRQQP